MDERIAALTAQIEKLQAENTFLKCLLDEAGISYVLPTPKLTVEITKQLARRFYSYFWGRTDVYSKRSVNKSTGKAGYYPQCENLWKVALCPKKEGKKIKCSDCGNRKWRSLEVEQIMAHLRGEKPDGSDVIGIYPLFPGGTCRFLVFDFDNHEKGGEMLDFANRDDSWMEEVNALRQMCDDNEIPCLVERSRSGRGGHLWIFFENAMDAGVVRRFGNALLEKGAETVNLKSFRFYDRMLPAQTSVEDGGRGYLIALPLQGQALKMATVPLLTGTGFPAKTSGVRCFRPESFPQRLWKTAPEIGIVSKKILSASCRRKPSPGSGKRDFTWKM